MKTVGAILVTIGVAVFGSFAADLGDDGPAAWASHPVRRTGLALAGIALSSGILMLVVAGKEPDRRGGGPPLNPV